MEKYKTAIFFILMFFIVGCERPNILDDFFINLETKMKKDELLVFKNTTIDSSAYYFESFYEEYQVAFDQEIINNDETFSYLESLNLEIYELPGYLFLIYEFHSWLNRREYTVEAYEKIYKNYHRSKSDYEREKEERYTTEALNIILKDKARWAIGDTLSLIFPLDQQHYGKSAGFRLYPNSLEIPAFEDTFELEGILMEKLLDSFELKFRLKLIEISDEDVYIYRSKYKLGDELIIPLRNYAKPIE